MRTEHKGAARTATLTNILGGSTADKTIYCNDLTGWPTGVLYPFYATLDKGLSTEEKVLCVSRSGNVLTVFDNGIIVGRAQDDTAITSHGVNATIEHTWTALEADEANAHVYASTGVHGRTTALVAVDDVQTLKNKTMDGTLNTFSNIPFSALSGVPAADIGILNKSAAYTVAAADDTKMIVMNGAFNVTLPSDSTEPGLGIGAYVQLVRYGAGAVAFVAGSGATMLATPSANLRAQYSSAVAVKIAASTWLVTGDTV